MKSFGDACIGVILVLSCWLFGGLTWNYYEDNPQVISKDNWITLGLLVAGFGLVLCGLWAAKKSKEEFGIVLAVVGTLLVVLAAVHRAHMVTIWLGVIICAGLVLLASGVVLAQRHYGSTPTRRSKSAGADGASTSTRRAHSGGGATAIRSSEELQHHSPGSLIGDGGVFGGQ